MAGKSRLHALVATAAMGGLVSWDALHIGDFRVDDAYVTFAFSKNLARGRGPIYGYDMVVEGYSNFLWMVVGAVCHLLPGDIMGWIRVVGFACLAVLVYSTIRLARLQAGWIPSVGVAMAIALCTDATRATLCGLETIPYAAAITWGFLVHLREHSEARVLRWSALAMLPAALLRIDGVLPLLYLLAFHAIDESRNNANDGPERPRRWLDYLRWAGPAVAVVGLYWLWRYSYYGLPFPTTYYAKSLVVQHNPYCGVEYVIDGITSLGWIPALALAFVAIVQLPRRATFLLTGFVVCHLVYVAKVGGDWMPLNRFLLPLLGPVLVLAAWGAQALCEVRWKTALLRVAVVAGLATALGYLIVFENAYWVMSEKETEKLEAAKHVKRHTNALLGAAPFVAAMVRKPGERLATDYGGIFAYYTDAHVIEMWGLCNRRIALEGTGRGINPIYGKTCIPCYRDFDPDYFHFNGEMLLGLGRNPDGTKGTLEQPYHVIQTVFQWQGLNRVLDFRRNYVVGRVRDPSNGDRFFFLEKRRPGVPLAPRRVNELIVDYPMGT